MNTGPSARGGVMAGLGCRYDGRLRRAAIIAAAGTALVVTIGQTFAAALQPPPAPQATPETAPPVAPETAPEVQTPAQPPAAEVQAPPAAVVPPEQPEHEVSEFQVEYKVEHPGLPLMTALLGESVVELGVAPGGFVTPEAAFHANGRKARIVRISLAELNDRISGRTPMDAFIKGEVVAPDAPDAAAPAADVAAKPAKPSVKFSSGALWRVLNAIKNGLLAHGLNSVLVETNNADMELDLRASTAGNIVLHDLRGDDGRTTLRLTVYVAIVTRVRTIAGGDRIAPPTRINAPGGPGDSLRGAQGGGGGTGGTAGAVNGEAGKPNGEAPPQSPDGGEGGPVRPEDSLLNNPIYERIREHSPVQPAGMEAPGEPRRDLLRKAELDDYVLRLKRYPGRFVDVAVSGADDASGVGVEVGYIVRESSPLTMYTQVSNTGTKETNVWRERFGFQTTQLTNNDDFLALDYITGGFSESHQVSGSYEFPLLEDGLRVKLSALYSSFDASEVGASDEKFTGETWFTGADVAWNFFQHREIFVDATAGLRYQNLSVSNKTVLVDGHTGFLLPTIGLRGERLTDVARTNADVQLMYNLSSAATNQEQLNNLGRLNTESNFSVLSWNVEQSFFLEPLFNTAAWERGESTLANEVALSVRGQYAFNNRLVPNFEQIAGGLYSVRGYNESIASGDTVVIASAEYRLHIPRLLSPSAEPGQLFGKPFNWRPPQAYARPDWDMIGKLFIDGAWTHNNQALSFEHDEQLLGTGAGLEFVFKDNFTVRVDWGFALRGVRGKADAGDCRVHFVATLLF